MVRLTILNSRANSLHPPSRPMDDRAACPKAVAASRRADPEALGLMTSPARPASSQEGFFWKTKTLEEMSSAEWESLCDGCARCGLERLEDKATGKVHCTHAP